MFLTEICFVHNKLEEQLPPAGALSWWEELLPKELPFQFSVAWKNFNPLLITFCLFPKDLGTLKCCLCQIIYSHFQVWALETTRTGIQTLPPLGVGEGWAFLSPKLLQIMEGLVSILLSPCMGMSTTVNNSWVTSDKRACERSFFTVVMTLDNFYSVYLSVTVHG